MRIVHAPYGSYKFLASLKFFFLPKFEPIEHRSSFYVNAPGYKASALKN